MSLFDNIDQKAPVANAQKEPQNPLTEKYRPYRFVHLVGNRENQEILAGFALSDDHPLPPLLIFDGGPGVAKTSFAMAFATEYMIKKNVVSESYNPYKEGTDNFFLPFKFMRRTVNKQDCLPGGEVYEFLRNAAPANCQKVFIIDEADRITNDALIELRPLIEKSKSTCFVWTTNKDADQWLKWSNFDNRIHAVHDRAIIIHFKPMSQEEITTKLKDIAEKEGLTRLTVDSIDSDIQEISKRCTAEQDEGSFRQALRELSVLIAKSEGKQRLIKLQIQANSSKSMSSANAEQQLPYIGIYASYLDTNIPLRVLPSSPAARRELENLVASITPKFKKLSQGRSKFKPPVIRLESLSKEEGEYFASKVQSWEELLKLATEDAEKIPVAEKKEKAAVTDSPDKKKFVVRAKYRDGMKDFYVGKPFDSQKEADEFKSHLKEEFAKLATGKDYIIGVRTAMPDVVTYLTNNNKFVTESGLLKLAREIEGKNTAEKETPTIPEDVKEDMEIRAAEDEIMAEKSIEESHEEEMREEASKKAEKVIDMIEAPRKAVEERARKAFDSGGRKEEEKEAAQEHTQDDGHEHSIVVLVTNGRQIPFLITLDNNKASEQKEMMENEIAALEKEQEMRINARVQKILVTKEGATTYRTRLVNFTQALEILRSEINAKKMVKQPANTTTTAKKVADIVAPLAPITYENAVTTFKKELKRRGVEPTKKDIKALDKDWEQLINVARDPAITKEEAITIIKDLVKGICMKKMVPKLKKQSPSNDELDRIVVKHFEDREEEDDEESDLEEGVEDAPLPERIRAARAHIKANRYSPRTSVSYTGAGKLDRTKTNLRSMVRKMHLSPSNPFFTFRIAYDRDSGMDIQTIGGLAKIALLLGVTSPSVEKLNTYDAEQIVKFIENRLLINPKVNFDMKQWLIILRDTILKNADY